MDNTKIQNVLKGNQSYIGYEDIISSEIFLKKHGYEYIRILGIRTFCVVMEFKIISRNEKVAIKVISVKEEGATQTWIEEKNIISQISSPFVVKIKEYLFHETQKLYQIVSEFCSGGSLGDVIEKNSQQLSLPFIIDTFSAILQGLMDIHSQNIIHSDLKPQNILFTSEGKPLLADIWQSNQKKNILEESTKEQNLLYSPYEQDERNLVIESNYYSSGMVLFLMCRPITNPNEILLMKSGSFPSDIQQHPNFLLLEIAISMMNTNPKLRNPPSEVLSKLELISNFLQSQTVGEQQNQFKISSPSPNVVPLNTNNDIKYFDDGSFYEGTLVDGKRHGYGKQMYGLKTDKEGDIYVGEWKEEKMHGQGIYYYENGNKYDGQWIEANEDGQGIFYCPNGSKYDGQWKKGMHDGQGIWYCASGDKYDGHWKEGMQDGQGIFYYANGQKYDGQWKGGMQDGQGIYYCAFGNKYKGKWKGNMREGQGICYYKNGDKYDGQWKKNKRSGQGIMYYASSEKYEGQWNEGMPDGQGILYYPSGMKYDGKWKEGMIDGQGSLYNSKSEILLCGSWTDGEFQH